MEDRERLTIVLRHLIEHNEGHAEDYARWIDLAKNGGMNEVAGLIGEAAGHAEKAGTALKTALDLLTKQGA
jgi:hypothetical protein